MVRMAYLKFECDGVPLSLVRQQIQTLDYELHASLRIVAGGKIVGLRTHGGVHERSC